YIHVSALSTASCTVLSYILSLHDALPISKAGIILSPSTIEVAKIKLLRMKASNIAINIALPHSIHSFLFLLVSAMKTPLLKYKSSYRSEEHTSELQSRFDLVCRLLLEKK